MKSKWCVIPCFIVAVVVVGVSFRTIYPKIVAPMPDSWAIVRPGMTSNQARGILGEPWADGRELKIVDRWRFHRGGVTAHLDLWYDDENTAESEISRVVRWWRFGGSNVGEEIDPPWQN